MSVRLIAAACAAILLAGCTGSQDTTETGVSPNVAASRGYDAYNRGDFSEAAFQFETALAADPGNTYAAQGLTAARDSIVFFGDGAVPRRARDAKLALYRASVQGYEAHARGDYLVAAAQFEEILRTDPGNAYALKGRRVAEENARRRAVASSTTYTQQVVTVAPSYAPVPQARPQTVPQIGVLGYESAPVVGTGTYEQAYGVTGTVDIPSYDGGAGIGGNYSAVGSYEDYVSSQGAALPVSEDYGSVVPTYAPSSVMAAGEVVQYGQGFGTVGTPIDATAGSDGLIYLGN